MKNQYVGDIGDYGKYGLLRFIADKGIKIGVNWYLTENDGPNVRQHDGKYIDYLKKDDNRIYDEELYDFLKKIAFKNNKSVKMIENADIIKNAVYYSDKVGIKDRDEWHKKGMSVLKDADLIFCDPDNGSIGKTNTKSKSSVKYVLPQEIAEYYEKRKKNVVYYCQRGRRSYDAWMEKKLEMKSYVKDALICSITYHRGTQRSYIFVIHPDDYRRYVNVIYDFLRTKWGTGNIFTQDFLPHRFLKEEEPGSAMNIELESGEIITLRYCNDGYVEKKSSYNSNITIRMKAEDFVKFLG